MPDGRLRGLLKGVTDVRPEETRTAVYFFLFFFLITFPAYINKTVKEGLLISGVKPAWWPYADLITAVLIGFVVALNARLLDRLPRRNYISAIFIFFMSNLFMFWFIFDFSARLIYQTPVNSSGGFAWMAFVWYGIQNLHPALPIILFCFWADVFIATSVTQFWIAVNDVVHPHQAKRIVGFLVSGGLLGGIAGTLLCWTLAKPLGTVNLLLVGMGILVLTLITINLIYSHQERLHGGPMPKSSLTPGKVGYLDSLKTVRGNSYLRTLAAVLSSAMIVAALVNYQFKIVIRAWLDDNDARTAFIGSFLFVVLLVSAMMHMLLTERVLRKFKIRIALVFAPLVLLFTSLSVFLIPAAGLGLVIWAASLRGSDKFFDNTLTQAVRELLYIPIAANIKYKAKIFIDMFVNKLAAGFAAILYILVFYLFHFSDSLSYDPDIIYGKWDLLKQAARPIRVIGVPVILFAAIWIGLIFVISRKHEKIISENVSRLWPDPEKKIKEHVDIDQTIGIVDLVQSSEKSLSLFLMNLFDLAQKGKLTSEQMKTLFSLVQEKNLNPELKEFLSAKSDHIRAESISSLLGVRGDVFRPEIVADKDLGILISEIEDLEGYQSLMSQHLQEIVENGSSPEVKRTEAARLLGRMNPTPENLGLLAILLQDRSPDVRYYALASAGHLRRKEHVPLIIDQIGDPQTRQAAQDALTAFGGRIVDDIKKALRDPDKNLEIRTALPEVLARIGTQKAANVLFSELALGEESTEQEVISALKKIKSSRPSFQVKRKKVMADIFSFVRRSYQIVLEASDEESPAKSAPADATKKARLDIKFKRICDLLTLIYPAEDIDKACQNILKGDKASIDYSLSLLDQTLDKKLRAALFPLIEDLPEEERARRLRKLSKKI